MNSQLGLSGKRAIITGASRGIGLAIAQAFASAGVSQLFLTGRSLENLEKAKSLIEERNRSTQISLRKADIKHKEFWVAMSTRKDLLGTDILVNCAGITHASPLLVTSAELIDEVVDTNLMGTIWACQSIGKSMLQQKRTPLNTACIINVASLLGIKGGTGSAAYAASKAGVIGLTRALSTELGPRNIRVNAILPGYIETSMTEGMTEGARTQALTAIPQHRFGTTEEVAAAAVFLATNAYANNCILNLDGGLSAT